jgi:ABC-2 type transport system ATP-binding protein
VSNAVEIQGVSKRFRLYQEKYTSLKERVIHAGKLPYEEFWALKDVNVEIEAGKSIGILGRNGCGKSTLLKCVAGILQPTSGQVVVRGHLAAMLELGAGMQPELSGRDNIYLNGSLLGLSRKDIDRRFDAIVDFAELEQFIDNQVKYYSSGMYVRLGFAVAVNVEPDVLLVDEVLAVGDERFQQKCLDKVKEFQEDGRTIIVVSHAPDMLREICSEIIVIDHGNVVSVEEPGEAIRTFRNTLITAGLASPDPEEGEGTPNALEKRLARFTSLTADYPGFGERPYLVTGEALRITAKVFSRAEVPGARFGVVMLSERNEVVSAQISEALPGGDVLDAGESSVSFVFDNVPLLDGRYTVNVDVRDGHGIMLAYDGVNFEVMNPGHATGLFAMPMRMEMGDNA